MSFIVCLKAVTPIDKYSFKELKNFGVTMAKIINKSATDSKEASSEMGLTAGFDTWASSLSPAW